MHDLAARIAHGIDARQKSSERPVRTPQREHHLERCACVDGVLPTLLDDRKHRRVVHAFPPPAFHVARRRARIGVPLVVVPVDPAVGPRHPRQVRVRIGERPEQMLALPQFVRHARALDRLPGAARDPLHEFDFARCPMLEGLTVCTAIAATNRPCF